MVTWKREGQTTQWPNEKEKDRQHNGHMKKRRTDNTMVTWKREGQTTQWPHEKEKDRQHNGHMKKDKRQTTIYKTPRTQKTKDRATRIPLKSGDELRCSGRQAAPSSLLTPVYLFVFVFYDTPTSHIGSRQDSYIQPTNQRWSYQIVRY